MQEQAVNRFYSDQRTRGRVRGAINEYLGFFDESKGGDVKARQSGYTTMINHYYDLVTDFYEQAWSQSFHFAPRFKGESFDSSLARSEHTFALKLGLAPGMKVLDVGCGVGGPMRTIARFSGATIEGVNNNDYQLTKVRKYNEAAGLTDLCSGFKGDFMNLQVPDEKYDAAYAFEATCHAPDKVKVFKEIHRTLKPGGLFAAYEWCMTSRFDPNSTEHQRIKKGIEEGDSLPDIATIPEVLEALGAAGFEVIESHDAAGTCDPETPWYLPLVGETNTLLGLRRGRHGRFLADHTIRTLEGLRIAPKGSTEVSKMLSAAAESLIAGGERGIFSPNYFFLARRPAK
ncbi:MAG: methyltransferase domain-containing protein [Myxococcales bacterium]|nr:methyltransferase domain-containing protein [Myxococcales bacterium]